MNLLIPFADFVARVVLPNNPAYRQQWLRSSDCIPELEELRDEYHQAFGADPFEVDLAARDAALTQLQTNLRRKGETTFEAYDTRRGNGIPNALLNKHFEQFVRWYDTPVTFPNLQSLVNKVHGELGAAFCRRFQEERISLNGNERVASNTELFTEVKDDEWTINKGGEKEVQLHLAWDDESLYYGIGFNAQKSRSNLDALRLAQPFAQAFWAKEAEVRRLLSGFAFRYDGEAKLKALKEGDFVCLCKDIEYRESATSPDDYEIAGLDFLALTYDLRQRLFQAYKLIFQQRVAASEVTNMIDDRTGLLRHKGQIILQGPPGTGKTRAAEEIAFRMVYGGAIRADKEGRSEDLRKLEQSGEYKLVQFHPAYSYEDFVRGITAKAEGGQISYEVENRTLAAFAKKAKEDWEASRRTPVENARRAQVQSWLESWRASLEERIAANQSIQLTPGTRITRITDDGIRYHGNTGWKMDNGVPFGDVVEMYLANVGSREEVKTLAGLTQSAKTNSTYWWYMVELFRAYLQESGVDQTPTTEQKPDSPKAFVLVVDEINRANLPAVLGELIYALEYRGREVSSLYSHPIDGPQFVLPPNLFLIGTMNTADRSVGHIDYAIRRRFAFVDVLPEASVVPAEARPLFDAVQRLFFEKEVNSSKFLSSEFEPESVALGHSYFLNPDPSGLRMRWRYEIKPILKEYIRDGILLESATAELDGIEQTLPAGDE